MVRSSYLLAALCMVFGSSLAAPVAEAAAEAEAEPDFVLGPFEGSLEKRQGYTQDYTTGGNVNFQPRSNGYSVNWSNAQDFVVGKGWNTGSRRNINFSGTFQASAGTDMLTIYGWTTNPLIEYYVMENYNYYGGGGTHKGTIQSDGSTYDVYENTRVNKPSIIGTATFQQFISVRQNKRNSGTVTTGNHFDGWASLGMNLGSTYNYQVLATEGWGNAAGSCDQTVSG